MKERVVRLEPLRSADRGDVRSIVANEKTVGVSTIDQPAEGRPIYLGHKRQRLCP